MFQNNPTRSMTGKCRLSYEHLMQPHANQPGAEPKYSVTLLIPKTDTATVADIEQSIQAAIQKGVADKWGGVQPPNLKTPLHDGDGVRQSGEPYGQECKGCWVINASSRQKPEVVDLNGQHIMLASDVYSGMYARATINFFAYNSNGNRGIGCGLGNVQKLADGEPLGGRTTAADDFGAAPMPEVAPPAAPPAAAYAQPSPAAAQPQINPFTGKPVVDSVMGIG